MLKYSILSFGAFLFLILLCYIYNSKPRYSSIENRIFRIMMYLIVLCMLFEFPYYVTIHYRDTIPILNELICRLSWIFSLCAACLLSVYSLCLGQNYKEQTIMELIRSKPKFKMIFIGFVVILFIFLLLPFEYGVTGGAAYLEGPASYFVLAVCTIVLLILVCYFLFIDKTLEKRKKGQIYFVAVMSFITIPIQIFFPYTHVLTMGLCLDLYIIYFSLENPDLLLRAELEKMKMQADESSNAKSDFLSNMTHEIRSPMNAIVGFSESILNSQKFEEEEIKKDINNIRMAGAGLIEIINNILDISKIESGKESINNSEYKIQDIYYELISIIQSRIGNKNIKFITTIDENIPSVLYGDKTKVYQILLNLLTNAVKYTEVGKIFFDIKCKIINDKAQLSFSVSDTGYGIKKEDFEKLFTKFVRLDIKKHEDIEGTGLGLAITKRLVNLLNGKITFTSEYEVGTTFNVELNQKIINRKPIGKLDSYKLIDERIDYLDCSNYNILIVDDNKLNLKVLERLLEPYSFKITTVASGKEAIYKIKIGEQYDLIFMDHMMPGFNGIEVVHILKKLEYYDIPPIVAITANAVTGMRELYLKEGFDEYLVKPINIDELDKLINKIFSNRK